MKIGPSPESIVRRLETVGITPINNVVDISNYVLMEFGQPLHTFDFAKLGEKWDSPAAKISPFPAGPCCRRAGEVIEAIDHKAYVLGPEMCMICDARRRWPSAA